MSVISSKALKGFRIVVTSHSLSSDPELIQLLNPFPFADIRLNRDVVLPGERVLVELLSDRDAAIIGRERIDGPLLRRCPRLRVISKFGVGVDNIDFAACRRAGVAVVHSSGVNRRSVAEQTLAFMISLFRQLHRSSIRLREGEWIKEGGRQLSGKTIGVVGVGHIGREVIELLRPFKCTVLGNDILDMRRYFSEHGIVACGKTRLFRHADLVTIHTPLTEKTVGMVDRRRLETMKMGAFLINTARGRIVVKNDLKWALQTGRLAGAALDVFEREPETDLEFLKLDNLICTPHVGGHAREARRAMAEHAVSNLVSGLTETCRPDPQNPSES